MSAKVFSVEVEAVPVADIKGDESLAPPLAGLDIR